MKKLNIHLGDATAEFEPFAVSLMVRGVVTFESQIGPDDLEHATSLLYALMDVAAERDEHGEEYKASEVELRIIGPDETLASDETVLSIRYRDPTKTYPGEFGIHVDEAGLRDIWERHGSALIAEEERLRFAASRGDAEIPDDLRTLSMAIDALKFVSGEPADFARKFQEWAASKGREACVQFPAALPLAA